LRSELFEVRSDISNKRIARVIFIIQDNEMVLLHGFVKKSKKTPKADLYLSVNKKKELEQ
jgi:phage-related protein